MIKYANNSFLATKISFINQLASSVHIPVFTGCDESRMSNRFFRVRAEYPDGAREFRAVLQRRGDQLLLVGFGPHGGRGFVLQQNGREVELESHLPEALPFPAEFMLHDIQRVWFRGLSAPRPDGEHREVVGDEESTERWRDGRIEERTFRRLDDDPPEVLRAVYEGGLGGASPPSAVRWHNTWYGYTLILTTLSHQLLDES